MKTQTIKITFSDTETLVKHITALARLKSALIVLKENDPNSAIVDYVDEHKLMFYLDNLQVAFDNAELELVINV